MRVSNALTDALIGGMSWDMGFNDLGRIRRWVGFASLVHVESFVRVYCVGNRLSLFLLCVGKRLPFTRWMWRRITDRRFLMLGRAG
jgi:hypothetical protein